MHDSLYEEMSEVENSHWWFQARRRIVCRLMRRYAAGGSGERLTVCELGCGTGGNLASLAARHDVVGVDASPQAVALAKRRLGDRVQVGSLPDGIHLAPESCDVVLLTDVLEHIEDDAASAAAALRLLKPGGIVVATVPAYQWLYSPRDAHHQHFRRYGKREFARLWARPDAETVVLSHYNTFLFPPAAAVRLASKLRRGESQLNDLRVPARPVNRLLANLMASEANFLGRATLPFGLSLITVVRKRESAATSLRAAA